MYLSFSVATVDFEAWLLCVLPGRKRGGGMSATKLSHAVYTCSLTDSETDGQPDRPTYTIGESNTFQFSVLRPRLIWFATEIVISLALAIISRDVPSSAAVATEVALAILACPITLFHAGHASFWVD